ncbi:MAG: hypothetical protein ACXWGY_03475 [Chthoniobacterales bacterium]
MSRIARWLPRAFFESALIVLSILLALAVNEWRDHHERISRANEARHAFANEIRANRDLLLSDAILPHHKRLQAEYAKLAGAGSTEAGSMLDTGVHPAPLRDAAWRSFSTSSTLVDFAPGDVVLLSGIYRAQDNLEKLNSGFLQIIMTPRSDRETPAYMRDANRSISMYLNDVVPAEEGLVREYDRALEQLK